MPGYRNFADSLLSSELWIDGGFILLIMVTSAFLIAGIFFKLENRYRKDSMTFRTLFGAALCLLFFGPVVTENFNRSVALENVNMKYGDSKLQNLTYFDDSNMVKGDYTDTKAGLAGVVTFSFKEGNAEPFLSQGFTSDEIFSKLEKTISING